MNSTSLTTTAPVTSTPEKITAESKSNFSLSFFFLPRDQRRGLTHFYALSRLIDDAVDENGPEVGKKLLHFWREEIRLCYEGTPTHPVTQAMQETIQRFAIPKKYLDLLMEGCEWDLIKNRYETYDDLYQYCYRVAGCIGLISMKIFGLEGAQAEKAAEELGVALQLTNILRDIKTDAAKNRIYIPREDIRRYRLTESEVTEGKMGPKLHILLKLMADRAETHYDRAFTEMKKHPRKPLIAAWIMGRIYYEILKKIRAKNYDVYSKKISLGKAIKVKIAFSEYFRALRQKSPSPSTSQNPSPSQGPEGK